MLEDTTAIVTGASQGIGREIATTLADRGAAVSLAARSDGIYETADKIDHDRVLPVETDVTDEQSVESSIKETVAEFGRLDCIVNNAGIAGPTKPIEEVTRSEWEKTQSVNVTGAFLMVKHAATHLRESDRGRIVNIASISGKRPLENRTPYTASKMAVIGLTRTLAFELGEDDITVNAVCPGATKGPRIQDVIERQAEQLDVSYEEAKRQVFTDDVALGRLTESEDVAEMVAFLASEQGRNVTAQDLNVDAGTVWY
ncbi:SDR family NAD(P)-dependent oxidoreductase [Haloarcula sp. JP-L23]|uniref:SDR family NAD(P)-dependent oxidoreductase n=1 Tax=Haloarcula sp. JP-L23 TaxID=2716717 RepID=UPI00140EA352|nr:SDR family oxidoreductase [Haloarcula sp. JP-L23]